MGGKGTGRQGAAQPMVAPAPHPATAGTAMVVLAMKRCASLLASLALCACASTVQEEAALPNFVLIYVDDVGYGDLGSYGGSFETPRLDQLSEEGLRFTDFYSASAICSPSRAALLTGRYPPRVGLTSVLFPHHDTGLNPDEVTIPEVLAQRGYTSACIGKWHLGHLPQFLPRAQGFDSYYGVPYSNDMDRVKGAKTGLDRAWREKDFTPWNVPLLENETEIERPADQTTLTTRYTDRAVEFIEEHRDGPFFLYVAHTMPHIPIFVSDDLWVEDPQRAYERVMLDIDRSVGRIVDAIDAAGIAEDTLVIFTSDNGPWLQMKHHGGVAGPLRGGKFQTWDGGMRVPCIMRWPGKLETGAVTAELGATIDLLPTMATLAGAPLPEDRHLDGVDLTAVLQGQSHDRAPFHFYRGTKLEAVRDGRWKLHFRKGDDEILELYDLAADIGESVNLAEQHPEIVARLTKASAAYLELVGLPEATE